jgi:hypothetical protein
MAVTEQFSKDPTKIIQWTAFLRKQQLEQYAPATLEETVAGIAGFLCPVLVQLSEGLSFSGKWPVAGPWHQVGKPGRAL